MTILTKKKFCFRGIDGSRFTTQGNSIIEDAPDWIAKTDFYPMAVQDGDIIEVTASAAAKDKPARGKK